METAEQERSCNPPTSHIRNADGIPLLSLHAKQSTQCERWLCFLRRTVHETRLHSLKRSSNYFLLHSPLSHAYTLHRLSSFFFYNEQDTSESTTAQKSGRCSIVGAKFLQRRASTDKSSLFVGHSTHHRTITYTHDCCLSYYTVTDN